MKSMSSQERWERLQSIMVASLIDSREDSQGVHEGHVQREIDWIRFRIDDHDMHQEYLEVLADFALDFISKEKIAESANRVLEA